MTSITPNGGGGWFPLCWAPFLVSLSPEFTTNSFRYPTFTNCLKWSFNIWHYLVVCPLSLWYVQYKLWFLLDGSPPIFFGHLKYGLFFIQFMILCTVSLNIVFTSPTYNSSSCILKSFRGLDWNPFCRGRFTNGTLPLLCIRSSSRHLYSSIHLMNCLISSGGFLVNDSYSLESSGSLIVKVFAAIFSLPSSISL